MFFILGKIPILTSIFQMGWNHQQVYFYGLCFLFLGVFETALNSPKIQATPTMNVRSKAASWIWKTLINGSGVRGELNQGIQVSNEKGPWLVGLYRGWNPTQVYMDYNKPL